jgi:ketosteroid isomerase-like protein
MTDDETLALADRLFRDIEAGDLDDLREIYHPDIVVWANYDDREHDLDGSMRLLGWLCAKLGDRRYDVRRRDVVPGGFVQEHVLRGIAPDGSPVAMPACIIATVADGRITRMHEYLDPMGVAALSA